MLTVVARVNTFLSRNYPLVESFPILLGTWQRNASLMARIYLFIYCKTSPSIEYTVSQLRKLKYEKLKHIDFPVILTR